MPESFSDAKRRKGLVAGAFVTVCLVLVVVHASSVLIKRRRLQADNDTNSTENETVDEVAEFSIFENYTAAELEEAKAVKFTIHGDFTGKCIFPWGEEPSYIAVDAPEDDCDLIKTLLLPVRCGCSGAFDRGPWGPVRLPTNDFDVVVAKHVAQELRRSVSEDLEKNGEETNNGEGKREKNKYVRRMEYNGEGLGEGKKDGEE
eukprot:Skav204309  [mRNA]  locus=scaffold453:89534:102890:- [translate_table: standard]